MTEDEQLQIERSCERLVLQFAMFSDAGEFDRLATLFMQDGVYARPMDPSKHIVGPAAIVAAFRSRPAKVFRHPMANILIEAVSNEEARGHSYFTLLSGSGGSAPGPATADRKLLIGEYRDVFRKTAQGWQIQSRLGAMTLSLDLATPA